MAFLRVQALALSAVFAMSLQACAGSGGASRPDTVRPDDAELAELEALYRARADSARLDFAPADVAFMQDMIVHHAQALVMAELAPERAGSAALRTLAARTINAQEDEIASMRSWLRMRDQPAPEIHVMGVELMIHGVEHDPAAMPGMLSGEQMRALEAAQGLAFDRLFLTYMIQHHSGAVTMVHDLFATDGAALDDVVFKIASDIQVDQTTEIDRMRLMLEALPDRP